MMNAPYVNSETRKSGDVLPVELMYPIDVVTSRAFPKEVTFIGIPAIDYTGKIVDLVRTVRTQWHYFACADPQLWLQFKLWNMEVALKTAVAMRDFAKSNIRMLKLYDSMAANKIDQVQEVTSGSKMQIAKISEGFAY